LADIFSNHTSVGPPFLAKTDFRFVYSGAGTDKSPYLQSLKQEARHDDSERQERQSQGVIREVAGGMERLLDLGGKVIATYRPDTDWTYDKNGVRIGTGNRLAGMVGDRE
jgi:hypothetical protein